MAYLWQLSLCKFSETDEKATKLCTRNWTWVFCISLDDFRFSRSAYRDSVLTAFTCTLIEVICDPPLRKRPYETWQFGWNRVSKGFQISETGKGFQIVSKEFWKGFLSFSKGFNSLKRVSSNEFPKRFQRVWNFLKPLEREFLKGFFIKVSATGLKGNTKGVFVAFKAIQTDFLSYESFEAHWRNFARNLVW